MREGEFAGVEAKGVRRAGGVIKRVAQNGTAALEAVQAGLVGATGLEENAQPSGGVIGGGAEDLKFRDGEFTARDHVGEDPALRRRRDLSFDGGLVDGPGTVDETPVNFADLAGRKEFAQLRLKTA